MTCASGLYQEADDLLLSLPCSGAVTPRSHFILFKPDATLSTHRLFSVFDALAGHHGVQKVETAGDCYIVAAGILTLDGEGYSEV